MSTGIEISGPGNLPDPEWRNFNRKFFLSEFQKPCCCGVTTTPATPAEPGPGATIKGRQIPKLKKWFYVTVMFLPCAPCGNVTLLPCCNGAGPGIRQNEIAANYRIKKQYQHLTGLGPRSGSSPRLNIGRLIQVVKCWKMHISLPCSFFVVRRKDGRGSAGSMVLLKHGYKSTIRYKFRQKGLLIVACC